MVHIKRSYIRKGEGEKSVEEIKRVEREWGERERDRERENV